MQNRLMPQVRHLCTKNEKDWQLLLFKKTQKLLDRLLFIFFAEDSGLLSPNVMAQIVSQWQQLKELDAYVPLYDRIRQYFGYLDTGHQGKPFDVFAYNGGLFKPDAVLDGLKIDDGLLAEHTLRLSSYDYASDVDVNILGHIFENSLSEIEEVTQQINSGATPQASKRKQDGVFYTHHTSRNTSWSRPWAVSALRRNSRWELTRRSISLISADSCRPRNGYSTNCSNTASGCSRSPSSILPVAAVPSTVRSCKAAPAKSAKSISRTSAFLPPPMPTSRRWQL